VGRPAKGPNYRFVLWDDHVNAPVEGAEFFFPSCSSIVKKTLAAEALMWWMYRTAIEGTEILDEFYREQGIGNVLRDEDLDGLLAANRLRPIDLRDERGEEGTREHAFFEALGRAALRDQSDFYLAEQALQSVEASPLERDIAKWWVETEPQVVAQEHKVWSLDHRVAGTIDQVRTVGNKKQVIDLKTRLPSNEYGAYDGDFAQGGGYTVCWREMYGDTMEPPGILVVRGDGNPVFELPSFDSEKVFLSLREVYFHLYERRK